MADADIKLEGTTPKVEGNILHVECWDIKLDHPDRRSSSSGHRRALVHGFNDELVIDYAADYPGGVVCHGDFAVGRGKTLSVLNTGGEVVAKIDRNGNFTGGGSGADGDVILTDGEGTTRIHLDAQNSWIRTYNASGEQIASIDGGGNLILGGGGVDGDVLLKTGDGETTIHLDAQNSRIQVKNTSGEQIARIDGSGNLTLGGGGVDGDVLLKTDTGETTITLDAENNRLDLGTATGNGAIRLRGSTGRTFLLDGDVAASWPAWPGQDPLTIIDLLDEIKQLKEKVIALEGG